MNYLIDTNIFIPLEPTAPGDVRDLGERVIAFAQQAHTAGFKLFVHPAQEQDLAGDKNHQRRAMREALFRKYPRLPNPPDSRGVDFTLGKPARNSHDWVDHQLLAAVFGDAVDTLVTEDIPIHRKARRLAVQHRVATISDAIAEVDALCDKPPTALPAVRCIKAHNLNGQAPIFESVRQSYEGFDAWLTKCKREHRDCWVIPVANESYAGIAIVKREDEPPFGGRLKTLKICTFKIEEKYAGSKYGELLLRDVLQYAEQNKFQQLYVEAFPHQEQLIDFLEQFGFVDVRVNNERGEQRLAKKFVFTDAEYASVGALEFNRRYGPSAVKWQDVPAFVIPIKPKYHDTLFPEATTQGQLIQGDAACGNALRKAYLCNATTREIRPGAVLAFYRSEDVKAVTVIGVAEDTCVADDPVKIARFVGKRTVYPFRDIKRLCSKHVIAILFRQAQVIRQPIRLDKLIKHDIIAAAPQSIMKLSTPAKRWLQNHVSGQ